MRKLISCVLSVAMMAAVLTGCGGTDGGSASASGQNAGTSVNSAQSTVKASTASSATSGKTYKVGIVQFMDHASLNQITESMEKELDARAGKAGATFNYKDYFFNGQGDATVISQAMSQLKDDGVDIVIPIATPAVLQAQSAFEGTDTPIVFSAVTDPVGAKLVASEDAPGGRITGTSDALNTNKVMDLIFAENPGAKKIGLLYSTSEDSSTQAIKDAKAYLDKKGIKYDEKTGTNADEVSMAADSLVADGVDAVFTPTDNTVMSAELAIYQKFIDAKIPHYAGADSFAINGAFLGFGISYTELGTKTADMAADILLNGKDPASMPVETLDSGIATLNTDTAAALGIDKTEAETKFKGIASKINEVTTEKDFAK